MPRPGPVSLGVSYHGNRSSVLMLFFEKKETQHSRMRASQGLCVSAQTPSPLGILREQRVKYTCTPALETTRVESLASGS